MRTQQEDNPGALGGGRSGTSFQEDFLEVAALMEKTGLNPGGLSSNGSCLGHNMPWFLFSSLPTSPTPSLSQAPLISRS